MVISIVALLLYLVGRLAVLCPVPPSELWVLLSCRINQTPIGTDEEPKPGIDILADGLQALYSWCKGLRVSREFACGPIPHDKRSFSTGCATSGLGT